MAKKFVLDLGLPYEVTVPVTLNSGAQSVEQSMLVEFNHITEKETQDVPTNAVLLERIVHKIVECFPIQDATGEVLQGDELRHFVCHYPPTQNALISAWRESATKKNLRLT